jgi:hypothetical protein
MKCRICASAARERFRAVVLGKYEVQYYQCEKCLLVQTEYPYWLEEAYKYPINVFDTGIIKRNLVLSRITSAVLILLLGRKIKCLDFAGGYGLFTRLMRDLGFDFYWRDKYTENLLARGFEYTEDLGPVGLVTLFEGFEHFVEPMDEIGELAKISTNILFSSMTVPRPIPQPGDWWYYGLQHGQHVSLYSVETLKYIAEIMGLEFYTNGRNLHMLTRKRLPSFCFDLVVITGFLCGKVLADVLMPSKTIQDMEYLLQSGQVH